jgi:uncharacterized repeat protein (TIGR01451 family)
MESLNMTRTNPYRLLGTHSSLLLACFLGLSLLHAPVSAQILPDAVSSTSGATANLSWPHTVGLGSNGILIVGVSNRRSNRTVTAITYAGLGLTRIGSQNSGTNTSRMELWYLLGPPQGTGNVIVTLSGSTDVIGGAASFFGIDPATPMGAFASNSGTGTTVSLSTTSFPGELVVDAVAAPGTGLTLSAGSGQTEQWNTGTGSGGNNARGASSSQKGASSVTNSWTLGASVDWAIGGVSLKPIPYPNLTLSLAQSNGTPPPGTTVTYTITYTNTGNGPATSSMIAFAEPPNTSFVNDGVVVNGMGKTDAADSDEVTRTGSTITVNLGSVPGGTNGTISYKVVIQ